MSAGHLAHHFRRRLIGDIPRRRLRRALDDDPLYALVDGAARVVLVQFLAPHASQFGLRGQGAHGSSRAALLGHSLGTGGLGFGNQALDSHLRVGDSFRCGLLMDGNTPAPMARAIVRSWSTGSPRTINPPTAPQPKPSTESFNPVQPNIRSSMAVPRLRP